MVLDHCRRREPSTEVGSKVKLVSGATLLFSRACLWLFGEYMLMSNQLEHREVETKGTTQYHESDPYPWSW
jgi:hypothetical protein